MTLFTNAHKHHKSKEIMITKYFKHYSHSLSRDMEYKTYGERGQGVLVFPSQNGRFFDYENFGMVDALDSFIEHGEIHLICVDSIDGETWSNTSGDPRQRLELHERWFNYIITELIPEVNPKGEPLIVTGCSMGGFHAANSFFRHPELFSTLIAQSGIYNAGYFFGSYKDDLTYANSPQDFLWLMPEDHPYLRLYRQRDIILCVGQGAWEDGMLQSTREMERALKAKNIPAWVDYWGKDVSHDWPWWRHQIVYFMGKVLEARNIISERNNT